MYKSGKICSLQSRILVIGGGPAGICAAIAAAREGADTILINNRPVLGGNSSSEVRVWTRGATGGGSLFAEEMGIWGELKLRNLYANPEGNPVFWDETLLDGIYREKGIRLLENTQMVGVEMDEDRVTAIEAVQLGTEKHFRIQAEVYVDATGDGSLGQLAGIPFIQGREAASEYGEKLAPEVREKETLGNTLFFFFFLSEEPVRYVAPEYALSIEEVEALLGKGGRLVNEEMNGCDYWWFELGGREDTIGDNQEITRRLRSLSAGVWNYIKNSGKFQADHLTLLWQGNWAGKRESRRMQTDRILTEKDVEEGLHRDEAAFYGGWYLDFHPAGGVYAEEDFCTQIPVKAYPVSMACLYNSQVKNLLFAGRDIGVSHVAFASTRIMNTCALSGQAAGTLGAMMLKKSLTAARIREGHLRELQERLYRNDVLLPYFESREKNPAMEAEVKVSSEETNGNEAAEAGDILLREDMTLVIPGSAPEAKLLFYAGEACSLAYSLEESPLPQRYGRGKEEGSILLSKGWQWISLIPEKENRKGFLSFRFRIPEGADIRLGLSEIQLCGFLLADQEDGSLYYPRVRLSGSRIYGKERLTDGFNRPWEAPHLWISGEEAEPWISLKLKEEKQLDRVELYLNPDLSMELCSSRASEWAGHHKFVARKGMPPELCRQISLYRVDGEAETLLSRVSENRQRHVVLSFAPQKLRSLKIKFTSAYGYRHAEVFEVKLYECQEETT